MHVTKAVVDKLEGEFKVEKTEKIAIMPNVEEETYFIADEEVSGTDCCNCYFFLLLSFVYVEYYGKACKRRRAFQNELLILAGKCVVEPVHDDEE